MPSVRDRARYDGKCPLPPLAPPSIAVGELAIHVSTAAGTPVTTLGANS